MDIESYVTEIQIREDSPFLGETNKQLYEVAEKAEVDILGLIRRGQRFVSIPNNLTYQQGDILIVEADPTNLGHFVTRHGFTIKGIEEVSYHRHG